MTENSLNVIAILNHGSKYDHKSFNCKFSSLFFLLTLSKWIAQTCVIAACVKRSYSRNYYKPLCVVWSDMVSSLFCPNRLANLRRLEYIFTSKKSELMGRVCSLEEVNFNWGREKYQNLFQLSWWLGLKELKSDWNIFSHYSYKDL